ncbi:hypothetical protein ACQY0O_000477 [Thecaphora frezii]
MLLPRRPPVHGSTRTALASTLLATPCPCTAPNRRSFASSSSALHREASDARSQPASSPVAAASNYLDGEALSATLARDLHSRARQRIRQIDANNHHAAPASAFLRDRFHRQHTYLRISLTERCNLRCLYCMPEDGVPLTPNDRLLTAPEVQRIAKLMVEQGVTKIRLTGGEPTVRRDLLEIVSALNRLRPKGLQQIGITSNGISLARKLDGLVASGLTHLNLSLDTLDPFKFEFMTRRRGFEAVMKSLDRALELGIPSIKINVVVIKGLNDGQDILDFVEFTKDKPITVRFIEYMPFDGNKWQAGKLVSYKDLVDTIRKKYPDFERIAARDDANDTSKHWHVPGHQGTIGFITSMTDNFCGTCNRLRITADGNLKVCLFGNSEVSLRDAMRRGFDTIAPSILGSKQPATDEQLLQIIGSKTPSAALASKHSKVPQRSARLRTVPTLFGQGARRAGAMSGGFKLFRAFSTSPLQRRSAAIRGIKEWEEDEDDGDDAGPWGDLDSAFDRLGKGLTNNTRKAGSTSTPARSSEQQQQFDFEESIFAQAGAAAVGGSFSDPGGMAGMVPGNQIGGVQGPHFHQSWSEYMGGGEEGDDSPWASLDAFADQSFDASTLAMPMQMPLSALPSAVQNTPQIHAPVHNQPTPATFYQDAPGSPSKRIDAQRTSQSTPLQPQYPLHQSPYSDVGARLTHVEPGSGRASMVNVGHKATTRRSATASGKVYLPAHAIDLIRQAEGDHASDLRMGALTKGPVLHTAQLAGIMAAKKTSDLIPLCHSLSLSHVDVTLELVDAPSALPSWPQQPYDVEGTTTTAAAAASPETGMAGFTLDQLDDPDIWMAASAQSGANGSSSSSSSNGSNSMRGYIDVRCTASTSGQTGVEMEALTGCTVACLTVWDMVKAVAGKEMEIGDIKVVEKTGGKSGNWRRTSS